MSLLPSGRSHAGTCRLKCATGALQLPLRLLVTHWNSDFSFPTALHAVSPKRNDLCALHIKECIEQQHIRIKNKKLRTISTCRDTKTCSFSGLGEDRPYINQFSKCRFFQWFPAILLVDVFFHCLKFRGVCACFWGH